ncbi:MAG: hypothetical protein KDE56_15215 [Anaerolineales bacterium]|nr:hypothetical protein [Anaerolineales bacterium]
MTKHSFYWLLIWFCTEVILAVVMTLLFALGLILIEFLLYPLALGIGGLLAALLASWLANRLVDDGKYTAPLAITAVSLLVAIIWAIALLLINVGRIINLPPVFYSLSAATILAITATVTSNRLRRIQQPRPHETRRLLRWLLIAFVAIPVIIYLASLVGLAGA